MSEVEIGRYVDDSDKIKFLTLFNDILEGKINPHASYALGALSAVLIEAMNAIEYGDLDLAVAYLKELTNE